MDIQLDVPEGNGDIGELELLGLAAEPGLLDLGSDLLQYASQIDKQ